MVAQSVFSTGLITSYCQSPEVTALLVGYDLSRLGDQEAVAERLAQLLPLTRRAVDSAAGHDFFWHGEDTVVLDGNGQDRLNLLEAGTVPLHQVQQVTIAGQVVPTEDYLVYEQRAEIRLRSGASVGAYFPTGQQNVTVTVDWGYPQVPADVALAQAKLTAAQLLSEVAGEKVSASGMRLGDYSVRYAPAGKYGAVIQALVQEAQELLRPYRRMSLRAI